ncbi:MAG: beta-ketoacyl-ACP synthase II [Rickettsiaceae bacterium]|nr:beta-ketoacyl-ACP synthase II [Rickettsiaceae bacterium]
MTYRRVVITGIGLLTPLGFNAQDTWDNLLAKKSGIGRITKFDVEKFSTQIAGQLNQGSRIFNPEDYMDPVEARRISSFIQYGIVAAKEAIEDSGYIPTSESEEKRTGVILGSGIGGLEEIENNAIKLNAGGRVGPFFIPSCLINLLSGHISIKYNFKGPNHAVVTACATGAHAIGDATRFIKYGDADVMVAGASEAPITPVGLAGFSASRALSTSFNGRPTEASRPWDEERDGFVMSEGAAVVVLEEYEHAKKRGAKIYAEVLGYGLAGDAYHITSTHPEGRGGVEAMKRAMQDAQISEDQIGYINAHGTSTKIGDLSELIGVQGLFGPSTKLKMSSTKSSTGHLLGAAGSLEAIFTALSLKEGVVPATLNLNNPCKEAVIDLVPKEPKSHKFEYAITNSFGFGGTNASLVLKKI